MPASRSRPATPTRTQVQNQWNNNPGRLALRHGYRAAHARVVPRGRALPLRRVRAVDARGDGVRPARRRAGARDRRRHGHRPAQFAKNGAIVTDVDLVGRAPGARAGEFRAARPAPAGSSITTPRRCRSTTARSISSIRTASFTTRRTRSAVVAEILRVLKPGGRAIVMVYAENSLQYWRNLVVDTRHEAAAMLERAIDGRHHVAQRRAHRQRAGRW